MYDITKDLVNFQKGGEIKDSIVEIIDKYKNDEEIKKKDIKDLRPHDIYNNSEYIKLSKKDKKKLNSLLMDLNDDYDVEVNGTTNDSIDAHFVCYKCGNNKPVKPRTLIYSKTINKNLITENEDYSYYIDDVTLPRTKNYICQYKKCETRNNPELKEAVITHNNIYQVIYVCCVCKNHWIHYS